jgi:prepilin-type N-terminal cleavage/methylation domain-containing protein
MYFRLRLGSYPSADSETGCLGKKMHKESGFSLIELLIVVAIILVIAAIAIPSLIRSKAAANEASAVNSIRTINTAETTFAATYPNCGYTTLANLGTTGFITDDNLAAGKKSGYVFAVTVTGGSATCNSSSAPNSFHQITADPVEANSRHFVSDPSAVIRYRLGGSAQLSDPAVQ